MGIPAFYYFLYRLVYTDFFKDFWEKKMDFINFSNSTAQNTMLDARIVRMNSPALNGCVLKTWLKTGRYMIII